MEDNPFEKYCNRCWNYFENCDCIFSFGENGKTYAEEDKSSDDDDDDDDDDDAFAQAFNDHDLPIVSPGPERYRPGVVNSPWLNQINNRPSNNNNLYPVTPNTDPTDADVVSGNTHDGDQLDEPDPKKPKPSPETDMQGLNDLII
jgi:hypothetical protein